MAERWRSGWEGRPPCLARMGQSPSLPNPTFERVGTDPTERAFYRAFRDFNPLNDLGSGYKTREAAVTGRALKQAWQIRRDK